MKRLSLLLLMALVLACAAARGEESARSIAAYLYPDARILAEAADGDMSAFILETGQARTLLVLSGNRVLTDNRDALVPSLPLPALHVSGSTVSWQYDLDTDEGFHTLRCVSEYDGEAFGYVAQVEEWGDETQTVWYDGGCLHVQRGGVHALLPREDLYRNRYLAGFDASTYPRLGSAPDAAFYQAALDALVPGYQALEGGGVEGGFAVLCAREKQSYRTLLLLTRDGAGAWSYTQLTRLPESTSCAPGDPLTLRFLSLGDGIGCTIGRMKSGAWGLSALHVQDGTVALGESWLEASGARLWGAHAWSDATRVSWNTLPRTVTEAQVQLDPTGWGVVNNPQPGDRLHLRQRPDAASKSLGAYATGAPVRVLGTSRGWVNVAIGGRVGWMKQEYLALGDAQRSVASACRLVRLPAAEGGVVCYRDDDASVRLCTLPSGAELIVLGTAGDHWYHVLLTQDDTFALIAAQDLPQ